MDQEDAANDLDHEDAAHDLDQEIFVHVQPAGVDEGDDQEAAQVARPGVRGMSYLQTHLI